MKIECDKCGAKYSIADEKVRGKTFKIRCKKCSNVIIVRDKAATSGAASSGAVEAADPGWHLAINGETMGPIPEAEVRQRYQAGEIDRETSVWQEGFEDWVALSEVPTFADLPERLAEQPASGGIGGLGGPDPLESPFAGANQQLGSAAAIGGLGAGLGSMGSESLGGFGSSGGGGSSRLTGQRNENSVLFSLDSLQSLATGRGAASPSVPGNARIGTRGLATVAPTASSERSGLIDIRALGAMVSHDSPRAAATASSGLDDAALPSFSGAGLGGLASAPLMPQSLPDPAAVAPPVGGRSNLPLYIILVLLIFAVAGLAVLFLTRDNTPQIVERQVPVAPSVKDDADDDDAKKSRAADNDEEGEGESEEEAAEEEGDAEEGSTPSTKRRRKSSTVRKSTSKSGSDASSSKSAAKDDGLGDLPDLPTASSSKSASASSKPSTPAGPSNKELSADCILDPSAPGCGGSTKKAAPKAEEKKAPAVDPNLPASLTSTDIRDGIESVKAAAKACGPKNGASAGTSVQVKLSIAGSTGKVTSAAAQAPHAGTALGNCVAAALKKAQFKKFQKASIGAVYPVRM